MAFCFTSVTTIYRLEMQLQPQLNAVLVVVIVGVVTGTMFVWFGGIQGL